jgi:hypothetical protein
VAIEPGDQARLEADDALVPRRQHRFDEGVRHLPRVVGIRQLGRQPARRARGAGVDRRVHRPGADHRHAHAGALLALLDRERGEEPAQGVLGGGVARERRQGHHGHDRGRRDDHAVGGA